MSSAYEYAEGGEVTDELVLGWAVDKYGAQAVYGRTLSFHEIRMMDLAENVYRAYRERLIFKSDSKGRNLDGSGF